MECNDAKWNGSMEYVYSEQRHNTALDMATLTMEYKCIKRTVVLSQWLSVQKLRHFIYSGMIEDEFILLDEAPNIPMR
ncbi:hypothetical protein T4A_11972 [Trichinella pseudospiralis]|uniref:Uncharacterized protein n=1 Tax=Trichinella pseudospiralis TaxID=6337 RepID=A0A0V1DZL7_TRIPS|nr:hypothetical protein T4A_11972 [Trichinella pseudospiralis]